MRVRLALCALMASAYSAPSTAPNFIIMLADDMGWGDVSI